MRARTGMSEGSGNVKREACVNPFWVSVSEPKAVNGDVGMKECRT